MGDGDGVNNDDDDDDDDLPLQCTTGFFIHLMPRCCLGKLAK